jgi:hypothetical protein
VKRSSIFLLLVTLAATSSHAADVPPATTDADKQRMVAALIEELASDNFAKREKAEQKLKALDKQFLPQLNAAFATADDAEVKARSKEILRTVRTRDDHFAVKVERKDGKTTFIIDEKFFDLSDAQATKKLMEHFDEQINIRVKNEDLVFGKFGEVSIPVKLKMDEDLAMRDVQTAVVALASAKLQNIQYETATGRVEMPIPGGAIERREVAHSMDEIVVPEEILEAAELGDHFSTTSEDEVVIAVAERQPSKILRIHARFGLPAEKIYDVETKKMTVAELSDFLRTESSKNSLKVRVSYEPNTPGAWRSRHEVK